MEIKNGFNLRIVCGENMVVAEGRENIDFSSVIALNETAAAIWKKVKGTDFTIADMVAALMAEYEVDEETATRDCEALAESWKETGILKPQA